MTAFRDFPIRRKLLLMTLASSAAALVLSSGGFLAWDVAQFRSEIEEDVTAQARIIAENSGAALAFGDKRAADETLGVLELRPQVRNSCLYDVNGALFAVYNRNRDASCPGRPPSQTRLGWGQFEIVAPVTIDNDRVGTLYIQRELRDVYNRLQVGGATVVGLLLLSIGAASAIATRMQRSIASPLLHLADTARIISSSRDYSLRAVPLSKDEIGVVVQAFNEMLEQIDERTTELSKANAGLEREVEERRRVEGERTAALERERDANRLKDEFLATLSHELRTPLNAVLGWTRVIRSARVEPATQARALESIERNALAQARLIEDLLEISAIVTGKLRLRVCDTDLAAIIDTAVEIVQPATAAKRLQLSVEIGPRPAMTAADPDRIQQVVWNLLSNAVKFTPAGGTVFVRLDRTDGYRLTIRDTGAGIDAKFLPFIFDPFRQADGSSSREHGGLGLGLAIAKQLVELHGGTIQARSTGNGSGATFEVSLPSVVATAAAGASGHQSGRELPAPRVDPSLLRNLRVLVVDDEEDARLLLQTTLAQYGADVAMAASADEAFAEIDRRLPDVLLSDIGMPREDGYSLLRRLRARPASQGGSTPAVAVTAYASASDRLATAASGYQAHVAKPFEPADVALLVARLGRGAGGHRT
jgi:signal transduction histidine kinase/ActR/RegA family two-component response regulator